MRVIDLKEEHEDLFCICLEEWKEESKDAGPKRKQWLQRSQRLGLKAKVAFNDENIPAGLIQYGPIEHSFIDGRELMFVYCIFIHGVDKGRGNQQGKGMGVALLKEAERDAQKAGMKGIAAWGLTQPWWMPAAFFEKYGFEQADLDEMKKLVWKPFTKEAQPPKWFRRTDKPLELVPGKVTVTSFVSGWCMGQNIVYEWAKQLATQYGDEIVYKEIDTSDRETIAAWGLSDAIYVNDEQLMGPPMSYEDIKAVFEKHLAAL